MEIWVVCILKFFLISCVGCDNLRVVGGRPVKPGEYPHVVFIDADHLGILYCTGSILSPDWILTAAHCLKLNTMLIPADKIRVFAGISNYYEPEATVQSSNGLLSVVHPNFQLFPTANFADEASYNDLGLLKLEQPFMFNSYVSSIALLPMIPSDYNMIPCSATGFGRSEGGHTLRLKVLQGLKLFRCRNTGDPELISLYNSDDYFCGYAGRGKFLDDGDSGSSLDCGGKVVGVLFWVKRINEQDDRILLHTAVHRFIPWILFYVGPLALYG